MLVGEVGRPLASLLLVYLILKAPPVKSLLLRLANGQRSNGAPKTNLSGQASVEFWQQSIRNLFEESLEESQKNDERRHAELMLFLRETRGSDETRFELTRTKLHDLSTPINAMLLKLDRLLDRKGR